MRTTDISFTIRVYTPDNVDLEGAPSRVFGNAIGTGGTVDGNHNMAALIERTLRDEMPRTAAWRDSIYVRACVSDDPESHDGVTCPVHEADFDPDTEAVGRDIQRQLDVWKALA